MKTKRLVKRLNHRRKKAFIGAAIGAVAGIAGSIISGKKKKKAEAEAFAMQQEEQAKAEGLEKVAAINASLADQSYVDDYKKRFTMKTGGKVKIGKDTRVTRHKKYAIGGKKKAMFGSIVKDLGTSFNKENLGDTVKSLAQGVGNGIASNRGGATTLLPSIISGSVSTMADQLKARRVATAPRPIAKYGTNKKFIGGAAGGIGSLIGSLTQKSSAPKTVKKADPFTMGVKTGLVGNSYDTAEGVPAPGIGVPAEGVVANPMDVDRLTVGRLGTKKRFKIKAKS